ncbi:hypothetical protein H0I76_07720 [Limibaculum sp. M0105]|uniref:Alpha/beta hydrolase n=1 Tax=Thermohalobaculum xanthum TaxID=2753746 RepID=A0A8J7SEP5_9RHOB|nr:hypothetical protein [Thermohalobaculum xanthum]MBK0399072.1 hypothetical protein [Thermohalobaculum xanthum]
MGVGSILRAIGAVFLLLFIAVGAMAVMPPAWIADPPSEEPRSMMGSGFVNDHADVAPWTWWWSDRIELRVDHPAETNIVIWNHHTEAMEGSPSCLGSLYFPPPAIARLERIGRTRVYYLCTKSSQAPGQPHFARQRRDEILALVARFRALGVPAGRIFLSGQSGGSCSSLMALGAAPDEMNAGILFAPACFGTGEGDKRARGDNNPERVGLIDEMTSAERITALLVGFGRDRWNKPQHLGFLAERYPETVEIFTPGCGADHSGAFHGCGVEAVAAATERYFRARLEAAGFALPAPAPSPTEPDE